MADGADATGIRLLEALVGFDGSEAAQAALRWAAANVDPDIGAVRMVTVLDRSDDFRIEAALAPPPGGPFPVRVSHRTCFDDGNPADLLLECAADHAVDVVVLGHRPDERFGTRVVGQVVAHALRRADRPVVIVPHDWTPERSAGRPTALGVGVAAGTEAALRWLLAHPGFVADGLVLAHALGPRSLFRPDGWLDVVAYHLDPTVLPGWVEADLLDLAERVKAASGTEVDVTVSVEPGRTGARLVEVGESAGLLVIGRGEPPFLREHVLAPYLRHAVVHAPCPIVVVPAAGG